MRLVLRSRDMMFWPENMSGADRFCKGHAMERIYFQVVYYVVWEEVIPNVSGDVFWREGEPGWVNWFWGLFRYYLTRL